MLKQPDYFIGLMSGTSMDAIDAALVYFTPKPILVAHHSQSISSTTRQRLRQLIHSEEAIKQLGLLDIELGQQFATVANQLIANSGIDKQAIKAIGSHGQTVYHRPDLHVALQIADPNRIAVYTGIPTVADFRRKDVALGGQGAPLTPAFHQFCFAEVAPCAIVNIGGIANITAINADLLIGFDCGPGNALLDAFCQREFGQTYDVNGSWARTGKLDQHLLEQLLHDPYFQRPLPKSTGTEYFNLDWLASFNPAITSNDMLATLTELTASSIGTAVRNYLERCQAVYLCGGGLNNTYLVERIQHHCAEIPVMSTQTRGIDPHWLEAMAFAWFAKRTLEQLPSNMPAVTGASRPAILGGIYWP